MLDYFSIRQWQVYLPQRLQLTNSTRLVGIRGFRFCEELSKQLHFFSVTQLRHYQTWIRISKWETELIAMVARFLVKTVGAVLSMFPTRSTLSKKILRDKKNSPKKKYLKNWSFISRPWTKPVIRVALGGVGPIMLVSNCPSCPSVNYCSWHRIHPSW